MSSHADVERATNNRIGSASERGKLPPGTVLLEDYGHENIDQQKRGHIVLQPQPSQDPNDPLNWSQNRKIVNFSIIAFYTLMIFAILDIGTVVWSVYIGWGITYSQLNATYALNLAGLGLGCLLFIPFALKYGRRPVYIVSTIIVFATAIWQGALNDLPNMLASNFICGLAGAVSESLCAMTIADIFFTHERGLWNSILVFMVLLGSFVAPIAAGYSAAAQGWRWMYWWCTILIGVNIIIFVFFLEETKYIALTIIGRSPPARTTTDPHGNGDEQKISKQVTTTSTNPGGSRTASSHIDDSIPLKTYRQRMSMYTLTPGPFVELLRHIYQPLQVLVLFPAVTYVAIQYGCVLAWFSMVGNTQAEYFAYPPYNFGSIGLGLLSLPPFIGGILGCIWAGPLSDWSILYFAKRNNGIYEPEMRLYILMIPGLLGPVGLLVYGLGVAAGQPWIIPCVGSAFYGFGISAVSGIIVSFMMDSYREIIGDAFVAVAFIRNGLSTLITFLIADWISGMGFKNTFILASALALIINLMCVPMIIWGKKWRIMCADKYERYTAKQFNPRGLQEGI